jgi:hypothetical protein
MKKCHLVYGVALIVACLAIVLYKKIILRDDPGQDFLNQGIVRLDKETLLSFWPISHFVVYFILGLMFPHPGCAVFFMVGGVLWEVFEEFMGTIASNNVVVAEGVQYRSWWSGRVDDIFYNALGYFVGVFITSFEFLG